MNSKSLNNKRIAKNTLLLYFRMLLMMFISLYTSRVILNALGIEDYGIYNIVGGVVSMFTILSGSLTASISRFITFELGKGDIEKLKRIFSTSINIQLLLIAIIWILIETIGIWFLNNKMVIPSSRIIAANWVFQFSALTFAINLLSVPYNAEIIAHEKMSAFAYISISEAICKLLIAFIVIFNPIDRLVFYGFLIMMVGILIRIMYGSYCKHHFEECSYKFFIDRSLLKDMFGFAGWNFFGAGSWQLMTQGVNLLLNIYFGVAVNAARGISTQVDNAVIQFVNNFTTAINPQITKSYALGDKEYLYSLMFRGAKYAYFLVLFFAIPIIFETNTILELWLKNVPIHTANFVRLAMVVSLIHVISNSMITAMLATGNIKKYQIVVGGLGMLVFPIAWLFFYIGLPPETAYVSTIIIFLAQLICRLFLMRDMVGMSIKRFIKEVFIKTTSVTIISFLIPGIICYFIKDSIFRFFFLSLTSVVLSGTTIFYLGLDKSERLFIINQLKKKSNRY